MVNSGIPWLGDIPKDWDKHRFKYAGTLQKGKLPTETNLDGNGLPIIGASEMLGKPFRQFSTDVGLPECNESDILVLWDGANAGIVASNLCGIVSSTAAKYSCADSRCDSNYTYYLLKGVESYFKDKVFGTTIPHMNSDYIDDVPLLLPSLEEQQKIASFLDRKCAEIDEMIALQEKIVDELKAYKQSVITEAVTKGLNPDVPMKDSGIEWIGKIPEHWDVRRLKYVAERHCQKVTDEVLPYIGLENIESFSENYIETDNEYDISQAQICSVGDVIFGKLRPYLGKARVIKSEQCCSSEFIVLRGGEAPSYLRYLMLSNWFIEIVNASTYGTKMPRANADFIMNMQVIVPPIIERKEIECYLNTKCTEIDNLISIKLSKIDSLKEYKKSIIYEYVTGKKEVTE